MDKALATAIRAAKKAGKVALKALNEDLVINFKQHKEIVTRVDKECESVIINELLKYNKNYSFWSEERPELSTGSSYRWVIDPLDGTAVYTRGFPFFGIAIALEKKGEPILGVHYFPGLNWLYTAQKGKGSYHNGKRIYVSKKTKKDPLLYLLSTELIRHPRLMSGFMKEARDHKIRPQAYGTTAFHMSMIAHGHADAAFDFHIKPGDIAAGILLVREAGGKVTDKQGKKATSASTSVVSSNGKFHTQLLKF